VQTSSVDDKVTATNIARDEPDQFVEASSSGIFDTNLAIVADRSGMEL
jgi:hypothetical protein